ncbi:hypothetical protein Bbelb_225900 [Branchiostoma belcheri]|nr:hypothetical protein Bbelb_225900 [Branchiostoma belcheri]
MEDIQEDLKVPEWFQRYRNAHQRQLSYKDKAQELRMSLLQQNQQTLSYALERVRQVEFSGKHAVKPEQDFQLGTNGPAAFPTRSVSNRFHFKQKSPRRLDPIKDAGRTRGAKHKGQQKGQQSGEETSVTHQVIDAYRKILLPSCSIPPLHGQWLPQRATEKSLRKGTDKQTIMFVHGNQMVWNAVEQPNHTIPSVTE